ncbi:PREDICTED: flotillin-1-like, partial [Calidris pugnax]|uniref:flotillin-1-like n=1 Tax=Calidris pugnax TaxID=198806 RepID=UPI00071D9A66
MDIPMDNEGSILGSIKHEFMKITPNGGEQVLGRSSGGTSSRRTWRMVKIQGQNKEMLAAACQMFLGKSESEIAQIALETLEGHQRAIMAHMTVEEIYKDRQKFSEQVFNVASSDLVNMGISVVSYTLKDIHDDQDYLHSLGKGRTAQVQRDARVGEAEAKRDAGIREARARQEQVSAQLLSETAMAQAQRDFQVQQAQCDAAVNARKAQADLAYQLQVARTKQQIEEQRAQVLVVERAQQAQLQEHEIGRRERELEATVRKPAEAERYRLERLAEAQRSQVMMQAEAEAEAMRVSLGEIYKDRQKFSEQVFNVASSDLVNMGISVVSYTLKDIHDDQV